MDTRSPVIAVDDNIISKLERTFGESLHIQDAEKSEHFPEGGDIDNCNEGEGSLSGGFEDEETKIKIEHSNKSSTFPYLNMMLPSSSSDEADTLTESLSAQSPHQSYSGPLPEPPKLISAMKGTREKQGGSQKKLTVKWAPDVYDPVPTSLSHTVKSKNRHKSRIKKSEKKSSKKGGHKRSYSKGGNVKDNKQWWLESPVKGIETSTGLDLDVDSHGSYQGISYLKPVTESPCHAGEALSNILEFASYIKSA